MNIEQIKMNADRIINNVHVSRVDMSRDIVHLAQMMRDLCIELEKPTEAEEHREGIFSGREAEKQLTACKIYEVYKDCPDPAGLDYLMLLCRKLGIADTEDDLYERVRGC